MNNLYFPCLDISWKNQNPCLLSECLLSALFLNFLCLFPYIIHWYWNTLRLRNLSLALRHWEKILSIQGDKMLPAVECISKTVLKMGGFPCGAGSICLWRSSELYGAAAYQNGYSCTSNWFLRLAGVPFPCSHLLLLTGSYPCHL